MNRIKQLKKLTLVLRGPGLQLQNIHFDLLSFNVVCPAGETLIIFLDIWNREIDEP